MDQKLLDWGWRRNPAAPPRLWLFTDDKRLADPRKAIAQLPRGRAGVVLRHDKDPTRWRLGHDLARICRARRLPLVVAGDTRLAIAIGAGIHLRGGKWPDLIRPRGLITSSAHSLPELLRASREGACLAFLSPAFPTESHPGDRALGPLRWVALARRFRATCGPMQLAALGGIDGITIRRLPGRLCQAAGAITALLP